jgi:hypothetical protein
MCIGHQPNATAPLLGALYFDLEFQQPDEPLLRRASVRISVWQSTNVRVDAHAPSSGIQGPVLAHKDARTSEVNLKIGGSGGGFGENLGIGSKGRTIESIPTKTLKSGTPLSSSGTKLTEFELKWTRGWTDDFDGVNRRFKAALLLRGTCP